MTKHKKVRVAIRSTKQVTAIYEVDYDVFHNNTEAEVLYKCGKWIKNIEKPTYLHNLVSYMED